MESHSQCVSELPPLPGPRNALFLDVDGTLLDLASRPHDVRSPSHLPGLLSSLSARLGGALALVTGRRLQYVDELLKPLVLAGAGVYGTELRLQPHGRIEWPLVPEVARIVERMHQLFGDDERILIEDKCSAVTVHFRLAPERAEECRHALSESTPCPPMVILQSKCAVEACLAGHDKGFSVDRLMTVPPFCDRTPVVVGDDEADETAFLAAARYGGYGIKVGEGRSIAAYRIGSAANVRSWLSVTLQHLEGAPQ